MLGDSQESEISSDSDVSSMDEDSESGSEKVTKQSLPLEFKLSKDRKEVAKRLNKHA